MAYSDIFERISNSVETIDGCWIWQGRPSNAGYGQVSVKVGEEFKTRSAHRVSYEAFVGEIPDGLVIDHLCRNRKCVNPNHLEAVTQIENMRRSRKEYCKHGHSLTNAYIHPQKGTRLCRECIYIRNKAHRVRKAALR